MDANVLVQVAIFDDGVCLGEGLIIDVEMRTYTSVRRCVSILLFEKSMMIWVK